ncbi:hypothetical protein HZ326_24924 [Fusarium oxysporum f. sp. albedinis]|nr:hypothetical protein HZ326_24924 [Fusarium oxysporum f. sp. albedinis]
MKSPLLARIVSHYDTLLLPFLCVHHSISSPDPLPPGAIPAVLGRPLYFRNMPSAKLDPESPKRSTLASRRASCSSRSI